jgi:uncharacterized caspase-like protein
MLRRIDNDWTRTSAVSLCSQARFGGSVGMSRIILAALMLLVLGGLATARAETRVALVVGNADYAHAPHLASPKNDATDMTALLKTLGFEVMGGADLDSKSMAAALARVADKAAAADVALFFYAGHGMQVNGENYLVPIDGRLRYQAGGGSFLVPLSEVMRQLGRGSKTNIVLIDASRDNPAAKSDNPPAMLQAQDPGSMNAEVLVAFSTAPGAVALHGPGRNSPFTAALLKHLAEPRRPLLDVMLEVRKEVSAATGGEQSPSLNSTLSADFSLAPAGQQ